MKKAKKCIWIVLLVMIVAVVTGGLIFYFRAFHYADDSARKSDVEALQTADYQLLYVTMFSEKYASEYPFEYYMAWETYKTNHCFEKLTDVADYIDLALREQENLLQVFTLFDPGKINEALFQSSTLAQKLYRKTLQESVLARPDVDFVFILPTHSLEYWSGLSEEQIQENFESYLLFYNEFKDFENVRIYFFGHCDWLIANSGNYEDMSNCSEEVINRMVALSIYNDTYRVTGTSLEQYLDELQAQIVQAKRSSDTKCDLSQYEIVFFGDSIIANYATESLSVPGIVAAQTGAETYNCAIGGQSAASLAGEKETEGLNSTLAYFFGENTEVFPEQERFRKEVADFHSGEHKDKKLLFVIEYGLNDYFSGNRITSGEDAFDKDTYTGALNAGIERLQQTYPEAEIVLLTPTFVAAYEYGQGQNSEWGGILTDYVDAVINLAKEQELPYLNCYAGMALSELNYTTYLEDGVHLAEKGRFKYANLLIDFLAEYLTK